MSAPSLAPTPSLFPPKTQIEVVQLEHWLDWVTQNRCDVFVALPMIQRGSVWSASKIATLWDSLLRGMPIGSLTVARFQQTAKPEWIRTIGAKEAREMVIQPGSLSLLDGQQRTLAMCVGWPWRTGSEERRVWVDFGLPGLSGQPFQLRVTTQYQPFGYDRYNQNKLSRADRRKARLEFDEQDQTGTYAKKPDYELPLSETRPYGSVNPLDLRSLILAWRALGQDQAAWEATTLNRLALPEADPKVIARVQAFGLALKRLFELQIALNLVEDDLVTHDATDEDDATTPALVVLFDRIANAGTPLSNADYIFSLIKHLCPQAHNLVQELHSQGSIASLLSANDLVMTAVRVAANTHQANGKPLPDQPAPTPKEFGRLLKAKIDPEAGSFLATALLPLINQASQLSIGQAFAVAHRLLAFRPTVGPCDPGLPQLAFPLLQRNLVQVVVLWIHRRQRTGLPAEVLAEQFEASREELLRFVLFWLLCVGDPEKEQAEAGKVAFELLRGEHELFPGRALYERLCETENAVRLLPPAVLQACALSPEPQPQSLIRTWNTRFEARDQDEPEVKEAKWLYARWFHRKHFLLWLQRQELVTIFQGADPLAGREEETPYDYDHICPQADWGRPSYRSSRVAFREFCEDQAAWIIGNSLGNYRIWDSSANRSDGEATPADKLRLAELGSQATHRLLEDSAITAEEANLWLACSAETENGVWTEPRAFAFQKVVEARAFRLFGRYWTEANFGVWLQPAAGLSEASASPHH